MVANHYRLDRLYWILSGSHVMSIHKVGRQLNSDAILEDASCTKACLYLSFTLLLASVGFEMTGIGGIDSIGAILIAIFSFREGQESFEKAAVNPVTVISVKANIQLNNRNDYYDMGVEIHF